MAVVGIETAAPLKGSKRATPKQSCDCSDVTKILTLF